MEKLTELSVVRLNITPSVNSMEDLFRYLEANFGKKRFLYFKPNGLNNDVFEKIGRLAQLHRLPKHWEAFLRNGIICTCGKSMLITSQLPHYGKSLFMRELVLERDG